MNWVPSQQHLQQFQAVLQWQEQKLRELEKRIGELQENVEKLGKQRTMVVERIEYKFDQLKIEKLDGTLHIGVSPAIDKTIEDFTVNGNDMETVVTTSESDLFQRVHMQLEDYLEEECPNDIRSIEEKYQMILGHDYRNLIVQDIRGQVDTRIESYLKAKPPGDKPELQQTERTIVEKVKADILTAIDLHIRSHKEKRKE